MTSYLEFREILSFEIRELYKSNIPGPFSDNDAVPSLGPFYDVESPSLVVDYIQFMVNKYIGCRDILQLV